MLYSKQSKYSVLANNCENPYDQCTSLTSCTYFENLIKKGTDALTVGNELRKLFCGFDGYELLVCRKLNLLEIDNRFQLSLKLF